MADTVDEDSGDVGNFPTPPRHKEDIDKQIKELEVMLLDFMMEHMSDFAELNPSRFMYAMGHNAGFLIGVNDMANVNTRFKELKRAFEYGIGDAEEVLEEQAERDAENAEE